MQRIVDLHIPFISRRLAWLLLILQVRHRYLRYHGRPPHLFRPVRFTEKLQWRKLFDLAPVYAVLSDKIAVRSFVEQRVGNGLLVPLLWSGSTPEDMPLDAIEPPFIIKSNHASGHAIIIRRRDDIDRDGILATTRAWLDYCHGTATDEPGYINLPRKLLIEKLILNRDGSTPWERKIFVFGGSVAYFQTVKVDPETRERFTTMHRPDWTPFPWRSETAPEDTAIPPPQRMREMIEVAETLGAGFDHVRVDLYEGEDGIRFGEMTLYSYSGLHRCDPDEADFELGACWDIRFPVIRALRTILARPWRILPPATAPD